jgi:hypothetical protein
MDLVRVHGTAFAPLTAMEVLADSMLTLTVPGYACLRSPNNQRPSEQSGLKFGPVAE